MQFNIKKYLGIVGLSLCLFLAGCTASASTPTASPTVAARTHIYAPSAVVPPVESSPINIILLIGDGMGDAHRTAARWAGYGQGGDLAMDTISYTGWMHTAPIVGSVTDSAAAGTALATGYKTNNGMIGMVPPGKAVPNILEYARTRGMKVGLISTTPMAHATPASFAAHVPSRGQYAEIAKQMLEHQIDVMLGGGENDFLPIGTEGCYPSPGKRGDDRNLIEEAVAAGYTYVCDAPSLAAVTSADISHLLGLFDDDGMSRPYSPTLAMMTQSALDILKHAPEGFFLMVEGGQIDWAAHDNEADLVIEDTLGFDAAVMVALHFAEAHPNTLVIVTADHETGGMALTLNPSGESGEDGPFTMPDGTEFYVQWSSTKHTGADVPVMAQGPQATMLEGTYENTFIFDAMFHALFSWRIDLPMVLKGR